MTEEVIKIEKKIYISDDDTGFTSYDECKNYEIACKLKYNLKKLEIKNNIYYCPPPDNKLTYP